MWIGFGFGFGLISDGVRRPERSLIVLYLVLREKKVLHRPIYGGRGRLRR
jgi:hypothetical protein